MYHLRSKYGLSELDYNQMVENQEGKCKICGIAAKDAMWGVLVVDHCHKTGKIRGLLCNSCNVGLGKFKDTPELIEKALRYLNEFA